MQYNQLGHTGLVISRLGFGAMTFGSGTGPMSAVFKLGQQFRLNLPKHRCHIQFPQNPEPCLAIQHQIELAIIQRLNIAAQLDKQFALSPAQA